MKRIVATARTRKARAKAHLESRSAEVAAFVLAAAGRPDDLLKVDARRLWSDGRYRVNMYREIRGEARLAHSWFVVAEGDAWTLSPDSGRITHDDLLEAHLGRGEGT